MFTFDVAAVWRPLVAVTVYVAAPPVMLQPAQVATPSVGTTGLVVQASVAPIGIANVMGVTLVVTVLPAASSTVTWGWVGHTTVLVTLATGATV